jgi:hypothetical protein
VLDDTDRGDVIGWALMVPVVMALTIGGIQVVMWYQARNVCQAAAHAGVQAGKAMGSSTGAGSAAATNYLSQTGGGSVVGAQASETVTATTVTVTCTANAERVIPLPGFSVAVNQSVSSQRERFTTPTDAP